MNDLAHLVSQMQTLRDAAEAAYANGNHELGLHHDDSADIIEDELRDLAYINACESDSPNSPDFENVLNAELLKLGIEE